MAVSRKGHRDLRPWYERVREANTDAKARGMRNGYRSGLEEDNAKLITANGLPVEYETVKIPYLIPETKHTYSPDFNFSIPQPDGSTKVLFIVETKGKLELSDRTKHILVKQQNPNYDIRFVFSRPSDPIYKGSKTTQAMWADKNGFKWACKLIPQLWLEEVKTALKEANQL